MNSDNYKKYLPLGSVVLLKNGKKRVMITGFCMVAKVDSPTTYDYCGCPYPEGMVKPDKIALFNHDQIVKIYHLGLKDQEEIEFKNNLDKIVKLKDALSSEKNENFNSGNAEL